MPAKKVEQNLAERNLFVLTCDHMSHFVHGDTHCVLEPFFQRQGGPRPGNNVFARMNHQRGRLDVGEMRSDVVAEAGLDKTQMGGHAAFECAPDATTAE